MALMASLTGVLSIGGGLRSLSLAAISACLPSGSDRLSVTRTAVFRLVDPEAACDALSLRFPSTLASALRGAENEEAYALAAASGGAEDVETVSDLDDEDGCSDGTDDEAAFRQGSDPYDGDGALLD